MFAIAITTDIFGCVAQVAAAGHDRTIINIKAEYVDAWLAGGDPQAMYRIFDDKRHPFYQHRLAA